MPPPESALADEMMSHLKADFIDYEPSSEVANFYSNRSVFVTGGTGFIGKVLVEKLLRSCRDIKLVYLLIRDKRGKDSKERLAELIQSPLFERIKSHQNGTNLLKDKLRAISGDITLPKFGISQQDMETLSRDVSLVFNSAATIRFDEPIDVAVRNNVYSVGQLVEFCDGLPKLEALIHLSTAYSNCHKRDTIYEIFYKPPMSGEQVTSALRKLKQIQDEIHFYPGRIPGVAPSEADTTGEPSRDVCELQHFHKHDSSKADGRNMTADLLDEFSKLALRQSSRPNSYTFTKAISEDYLLDLTRARSNRYLNDKIQVVIVRPSVVCGAWREPNVGFVDNFSGPSGTIVSLYTGALQAMSGDGEKTADLVPVDMTVNMIISSAWYLVLNRTKHSSAKQVKSDNGAYVFNFVSGYRNPTRWRIVTDSVAALAYKYPSKFMVRLPSSYFIKAGAAYDFYDFINHKCRAAILDFIQKKILRRELNSRTSALLAYRRMRVMTRTLTPFTSNQWQLNDANVFSLYSSLSKVDKELFHFDVTSINWDRFMQNCAIGSRIYALKDEPTNVSGALRSLKKRQMIYRVSLTIMLLIFYYFSCHQSQLESALFGAFERLTLLI